MNAQLYNVDGKASKEVALPSTFSIGFREDLVRRALLAEQSRTYQPQGRYLIAGLQTTAEYVGRYDAAWRRGRHTGRPARPRQKLGGGAMGDVRRIPSAKKGRRSHPQKIEKILEESINKKEYVKAIESAISGSANIEMIKDRHKFKGTSPIIIEHQIESITKTKELMKLLDALGLEDDLERSHKPSLRQGMRRLGKLRHFRKSVLIVVNDKSKVAKAGRNIPGVDVCSVKELSIEELAPGARPRLSIWSEDALANLEGALKEMRK